MNEGQFAALCALEKQGALADLEKGVGTLAERGVHRVVKLWLEPRDEMREVPCGRYIADIKNENGIFEIQTRHFYKMTAKLESFLKEEKVTVVYPVAAQKSVLWLSGDTGELTPPRTSPKHGVPADILGELAGLKTLAAHENISFLVPLLETQEIRLLDGWGNGGKRGAHRVVNCPVALLGVHILSSPADFAALLPQNLPEIFTVKDLGAAFGRRVGRYAQNAASALLALGVVQRAGKQGNAYLYQRVL